MFTWLNKQGVKSDKGFIVQSTARFTIEYRETGKSLSIDVESDYPPGGKPCERVSKSSFLKWGDGTPIPKEKQKEILRNFIDAMEFQGIGVIIDE